MTGPRRRRLWQTLAWACVVLALAALPLLHHASSALDYDGHVRNLDHLRRMRAVDAQLDQAVMGSRYGLVDSYDPIVRALGELERLTGSLDLALYGARAVGERDLEGLRASIAASLGEKAEAIERFKSANSAVRNSLIYLPLLAGEIIREARRLGLEGELGDRVRQVLEIALQQGMGAAAGTPLGSAKTLARLQSAWQPLAARPDAAPLAAQVEGLLAHARLLQSRQPELQRLLKDIVATPFGTRVEELDRAANAAYDGLLRQADRYRRGLVALAAALIALAASAFWRLRATARRLESTIRELNRQKFALDEHAIVGIYDAQGRVAYVNDRFTAVSGYGRDQVTGRHVGMLLRMHQERATIDGIMATVRGGGVWRGQLKCSTRDGGVYFADTTIVPFADRRGRIFQYVVIQTDVSERQRFEAQLIEARDRAEAATRAKSAFLANMSHELRTPLNAITGYSELILEDAAAREDEPLVRDVSRIRDAGRHLLKLIDDVLDLSKIEAGRMDLAIAEFAVRGMLAEVEALVRPQVEANGNSLTVSLARGVATMRGDEVKIRQALINLLGNAGKFTAQGRVTLEVEPREEAGRPVLAFAVSDTGIGMTPDEVGRIFAPFSQLDSSPTRRYGGTGLGLAIARRLAELMGGRIDCTSAPGVGSRFELVVPADGRPLVLDDDAPPARATLEPELATTGFRVPPARGGPRRHAPRGAAAVLVVDDEFEGRDLLRRLLERQGLAVDLAADAAEALAYLERHGPPSLIVLDLVMPGEDGFRVVERLGRDERWREIPVIVVTAKDLTRREADLLTGHVRRIFRKGRLERAELVTAVREQITERAAVG